MKIYKKVILLAVVSLAFAFNATAEVKKKKHPGKKLYLRKTCIACHGKNGARAILNYPNLAGQNEKYMRAQMRFIASGKRIGSPDATGHPSTYGMKAIMHLVSKTEQKQIANWLASLPPAIPKPPKTPIAEEDIAKGKRLYEERYCITCHGESGLQTNNFTPIIGGQKHAYITVQTIDIRDKVRTSGQSNIMYSIIKDVSDEDISYIADYLSQIDRTKQMEKK